MQTTHASRRSEGSERPGRRMPPEETQPSSRRHNFFTDVHVIQLASLWDIAYIKKKPSQPNIRKTKQKLHSSSLQSSTWLLPSTVPFLDIFVSFNSLVTIIS